MVAKFTTEDLNIQISKVFYDGKFAHWEIDVDSPDTPGLISGTAPTFWGVLDMVGDYFNDDGRDWIGR
jgi:hypothetical protein